jgi:Zn-dependent protease with chaperone function
LEIYEAYFTSLGTLASIIVPIVLILALFWFFRKSVDSRSRSRSLGVMMLLSIFLWLFIGLSLVVCFSIYEAYESQPEVGVRVALGTTLLLAVLAGLPLSYLLRRYSPRALLKYAKDLTPPSAGLAAVFQTMLKKVGVRSAELKISNIELPISFVAEMNGPVVVISRKLLSLLKRDEVEAVLAHELAHIKNSDTALKAMVTAYKAALPHDPIIHLVEAAFHREREMVADATAVRATGKPLSLASALLKIHRAFPRSNIRTHGAFSILGSGTGLMHRHPSINDRIDQLVHLAQNSRRSDRT